MKQCILFGAGDFGAQALEFIGKNNVAFYIDNSPEKQGSLYQGLKVLALKDALPLVSDRKIVIAISDKYINEIKRQLGENGINDYQTFSELKYKLTKEKLQKRTDYISLYKRAMGWIEENSVPKEGIICNSNLREPYPEVTGYYIPTLIRWGYRELAITYAKWLCSIQHDEGAWYDTEGKQPYIFDTAQILKGLLAVRGLYEGVDEHIIRGCDWLLENMTEEGRLVAPVDGIWEDERVYSELIHTYCLSPVFEAAEVFAREDYRNKAQKIKGYYTTVKRSEILEFSLLSHFYAYVMEAMVDIGEIELAKEAMANISFFQKESGAVPAYKNVDWVCSTGLFQLAIVWFRLGDIERGNRAFEYACKLQNESGGWYGSYLSEENPDEKNTYFPNSEISWATKYFLDALYYKNLVSFENLAPVFTENISTSDGRYKCVCDVIRGLGGENLKILDAGCGKGRYLKNLIGEFPNNQYVGMDLSPSVMSFFSIKHVEKRQGSLTNISFPDNIFDVTYTCEALEHAIDVESAVKELCRITKPGGNIVIVDKNIDMLGYFDIGEWEQWFDENELKKNLLKSCSEVEVQKEINFDNNTADGLFYCWIGKVK